MEAKASELALHVSILDEALGTLEEILREPYSVIVRDATIQRFEYTFELAWKLFRKAAKLEGVEVGSPRQALRAAFDVGLVEDVDGWFELLEDRNRTSHTYSARTAGQVFESAKRLPLFLRPAMDAVRERYLPAG